MVNVVFVHPDLGIGGAERLVVDSAMALKSKGHKVSFYTAHHDSNHCFPETCDGTLEVVVAGDWLPRSTFGKFYALWAYIRMIYVSMYLVFSGKSYDVCFVDQISACIPFLKLKYDHILFYCHYPDQLLTKRNSLLKRLYRYFIDQFEEFTTSMANVVLVNSKFTSQVYRETFSSVKIAPIVLYPSINLETLDKELVETFEIEKPILFLSLNRYERKKNIALSLYAMSQLRLAITPEEFNNVHLVIAGGYDHRVNENVEYYSELVSLREKLDLQDNVTFMKSPSNDLKVSLLKKATCLLYTPEKEHFGIVPIESMYVGTPVLAVNSGGPLETVEDGVTGFLRDQTPEQFSLVMEGFVKGDYKKSCMSNACHERVLKHFSYSKFCTDLDKIITNL